MEYPNLSEQSLPESAEATASREAITFVREVCINYRGARRATTKIACAGDIAAFIRKVLPDNSREHFVALYLDRAHQVIAFSVVATGTATSCLVHTREVFQSAIHVGAVAVVAGHNHPSGNVKPSEEDRVVTRTLRACLKKRA